MFSFYKTIKNRLQLNHFFLILLRNTLKFFDKTLKSMCGNSFHTSSSIICHSSGLLNPTSLIFLNKSILNMLLFESTAVECIYLILLLFVISCYNKNIFFKNIFFKYIFELFLISTYKLLIPSYL